MADPIKPKSLEEVFSREPVPTETKKHWGFVIAALLCSIVTLGLANLSGRVRQWWHGEDNPHIRGVALRTLNMPLRILPLTLSCNVITSEKDIKDFFRKAPDTTKVVIEGPVSDAIIAELARHSSITDLDLRGSKISDKQLQTLQKSLKNLTILDFEQTPIKKFNLSLSPKLKALSIHSPTQLNPLPNSSQLEALSVSSSCEDQSLLILLKSCPHLKFLKIAQATNALLQKLTKKLIYLDIDQFTENPQSVLNAFSQLNYLNLPKDLISLLDERYKNLIPNKSLSCLNSYRKHVDPVLFSRTSGL